MLFSFYLFATISAQLAKDTYQKLRHYQDLSGMSHEEFTNLLFQPSIQGLFELWTRSYG